MQSQNSNSITGQMGQIWIGPKTPPLDWMHTWQAKHPNAQYTLYDNAFLANFPFKNKKHIDVMLERALYAGVADLMRYEILYEFGGFLPEADSICLKNTDNLFNEASCYTVYENEMIRGKLVSPIIAAKPKDPFIKTLIDTLHETDPEKLGDPWKYTGNLFCAQMIDKHDPAITIFPSYYFNPIHYSGLLDEKYQDAYAVQLWGSTKKGYETRQTVFAKIKESLKRKRGKKIVKRIDTHASNRNKTLINELIDAKNDS